LLAVLAPLLALLAPALHAWDYEGHRIVNQLALASLPPDFPAFVREAADAERVAFLAGEPDRWRNVPDLPIKQANGVDHYCDLEQIPLAGLDFATLPSLRYQFALQFAAGRAAHADRFPVIDPAQNSDHSREWCGFAPWAIVESYGKLRAAFSYLKVFEELGTPDEIASARANAIYLMGVMGHYVGDCAQPLHTTIHHNGWVGENPHGYTTWPGIHSWIDGGFMAKAGLKLADVAPRVKTAQPISLVLREPVPAGSEPRDPMFVAVLDYVRAHQKLVEPLYQLEQAGKFSRGKDEPVTPEGRAFIEARLLEGGQELGAIWLTAWRSALPDDRYLRTSLLKRQMANPPLLMPPAGGK
jgi:hypothetical protein